MTYLQHHHNESSAPEKVRQETTTTTISTTTTTASSTMPLTSDSEPTMYGAHKSLQYGGRTSGGAKISNSSHLEVDNGAPRPLNGGRSSSHSSNSSVNNNNGPTLNHKSSQHGLNGGKGGAYNSGHHSNGSNMSLPSGSGGRATSAGAAERPRSGAYDQSDYSNGAHSWPILFAVIPPLGALIFGKSDIFSDMLTLILIAFFLYNIIKGNKSSFFLVKLD